jgi:short-subunit dehydrogenase
VLVNNAGVISVGPLARTTDAELERLMATNVIAPAALIRELLPLLHRAAPSRIVNVGSVFGDIGYPLFGAYSASKFGLRGLSIALRRELKEFGVGITYAAPRATSTDASSAFARLIEPMQMRIDDPAKVARDIWGAVARDADSVYAKGPERLFVLVQRLFPQLVDRSVESQMADRRIRAYLVSQGVWPTAPGAGLRRGRI